MPGCPIGGIDLAKAYTKGKEQGFSQDRISEMVSHAGNLQEGMDYLFGPSGGKTEEGKKAIVAVLNDSNYGMKTQAETTLQQSINDRGLKSTSESTGLTPETIYNQSLKSKSMDPQKIFDGWMDLDGKAAWKQVQDFNTRSNYIANSGKSLEELAVITGVDKEKVLSSARQENRTKLEKDYVVANPTDKEAIAIYTNRDYQAVKDAIGILVGKQEKGDAAVEKIQTISDSTGWGIKDVYNAAPGETRTEAQKFYQDPANALNKKLFEISEVSVYGSVSWYDPYGNKTDFNVKEGNLLWNPSTGKYDISYNSIQTGDSYHPASWAPDPKAYFEQVVASGKSKQEAIDWINAIDQESPSGHANWTCTGSGCDIEQGKLGENAGGGGSYGSRTTTSKSSGGGSNTLFIDTGDVIADVYEGEKLIGQTKSNITLSVGTHNDITVKKKGYKTRSLGSITIGNYPVQKTVTMTKVQAGVEEFIEGIGGVGSLTLDHVLYVYYSAKGWVNLLSTVNPSPTPDPMIVYPNKSDALFLYYILTGQGDLAQQMIDSGAITISSTSSGGS